MKKIQKKIKTIQKVDENTKYLKLYDRFAFCYALLTLFLTFALMFYPNLKVFAYFVVIKNAIMLVYRFYDWKPKKWHYFYFDFCYWCNFLGWFYIIVKPQSKWLFTMLFMNSMSPMMNYFIVLKQKLIFQNASSLTSFMMHFVPGLFCIRVRFFNEESDKLFPLSSELDNMISGAGWKGQVGFLMTGLLYYALWCLIYYIFVFILLKDRI